MDATYLFCEMPNTRRHVPYAYLFATIELKSRTKAPYFGKKQGIRSNKFFRVATRFI